MLSFSGINYIQYIKYIIEKCNLKAMSYEIKSYCGVGKKHVLDFWVFLNLCMNLTFKQH